MSGHACVLVRDLPHLRELVRDAIAVQGNTCSLNHLDVSHVSDFSLLFNRFHEFNGDISDWDLSSATNMAHMFASSHFRGDISRWNVSNVLNMEQCFWKSHFSGNLSEWNVSKVLTMRDMFAQNQSFFGDLSRWDVSSVQDMSGMFFKTKLRGGLDDWDVSSVTSMRRMFEDSDFREGVSKWNVANVMDFERMFEGANRFDDDLSSWNVCNGQHFDCMFGFSGFSGDISMWAFAPDANLTDMFSNGSLHRMEHVNVYHWWVAQEHPQCLTATQREHFDTWYPIAQGLGLAPIAAAQMMLNAWKYPTATIELLPGDIFKDAPCA